VLEQEADDDSSFSDNEQYVNNPVREPDFKRFRAIKGKISEKPPSFIFDKK
jgi:hypothetical protein